MDENKIAKKLRWTFVGFSGLSGLLGIVFFFIILIGGGSPDAPRATSVLALALGFFYLVFFLFIAEILRILMAIESNTKKKSSMRLF